MIISFFISELHYLFISPLVLTKVNL